LNACDSAISQDARLSNDDVNLVLNNGILRYRSIPFQGILTDYDEVNETYNETIYVNGKKEGIESKMYHNRILAEVRTYKNGLKVGTHSGWYKDGSLKFEYHYNDAGVYEGSFKEWYSNGQMVKSFNYSNGKENGSQQMWLSNGNIRANYVVKNGERFGLIGLKKCYTVNKK
jgi:antitoxin component YwqK of YwqJK toxin-antitoxin module